MLNNLDYSDKVKELSETNAQLTALKAKKSELEAWFLTAGNEALKDSKSKSVCYKSDNGSSQIGSAPYWKLFYSRYII